MKLQNLINKIEKAAGKKIEKNGNMFYLRNGDSSISFFENGTGSGQVVSVACSNAKAKEDDPRNANCYDSFERKLKNVVSFIS